MSFSEPRVLSIQVGMPTTLVDASGVDRLTAEWTTGIFKEPVTGPVWLGELGLAGDGQGDLSVHGGPHQAVLLYAAAHYPEWRAALGRPDMAHGGFGENFTVDGLREESVYVGDTFAIGDALVQVSQPRRPCWKLSRRQAVSDLVQQVQRNGRGGWYVRVLREGNVAAGQPLTLVERPYPEWSVARANDIINRREDDATVRAAFAACPALSPRWRNVISGAGPDRVAD
ncbi:MAG: MOSC domain-containing protein [Chloroflexota bacterium]|nr:MOSC domain-containing protein [Chloroflexota bacterium]